MDCSTIIVSYNTFGLTREAVASALSSAAGLEHEVIVVDNASPDGSGARLRAAFPARRFPHVHVLNIGGNVGFARANNLGAARARGRVLFFLNPDTITRRRAVCTLVDFLDRHSEAGAVGPHVLNPDGSDQPSVSSFINASRLIGQHLPFGSLWAGRDRRNNLIPGKTGPAEIVKGCALAIRKEVFQQIGGWDESYFMYAEEAELCFALFRAGLTNYFVREAQIVHYGGASSAHRYVEQQVVHQRSALLFLRRHYGPRLILLNRITGVFGFGARIPLFQVFGWLRPHKAPEYDRRRRAAARLFRWFLLEYA